MKNKTVSIFLILGLLLSLCSCFPTTERNANISKTDKITIEQLASQPQHIKETPFDKFTVDADVNICVKDSFKIYKAKTCDYSMETLKDVFLKDVEITQNVDVDGFSSAKGANGSLVTRSKFRTVSITLTTRELKERELPYFFAADEGSTLIKQNRKELFPIKELDFMSSADAVSIVDNKAKQLNIPVSRYLVYPVDYEYMKKSDQKELEVFGADGYIEHTKEDEFYLIVMRVALPNGSELAELSYFVPDIGDKFIKSGNTYAVVGKNGLLLFEGDGMYTSYEEVETVPSIIGAEQALTVMKNKYKSIALQEEHKISELELAYLPYLTEQSDIFEMKPTWLFRGTKNNDTTFTWAVDAVTGIEVNM